jgi:hypothetical protein
MAFQEPALTADYGLAKRISPKKVGLGHLVQEKQNLLWAKSSASAADVMQLLQSNGLVALPIYDEKRKKFIGVAHIFDVTMALLDGSQGAVDEPKNIVSSEAVIKRATERASQSIGDLLFNDVTECMVCFHCADPIEKAIKPLNAVPHHVLVTMTNEQEENEEQLEAGGVVEGRYRLLSQTDVVRFLSRHQHELERELLDRVLLATIDELGLVADRPVVSCFPAEGKLALDAFNEMKEVSTTPSSLLAGRYVEILTNYRPLQFTYNTQLYRTRCRRWACARRGRAGCSTTWRRRTCGA